ncbi:MAG TPA: phosphoribosylamine--glycine ligase [Mycobacteriales bacterium]|nr:phosphoribosylamine--glycine ligase [Mycobacteriales bacterium]
MRVLVIGGGGREHALCLALSRDPWVSGLFCAPGNPGIASLATTLPLRGAVETALGVEADLVVVGPEAPLVDGVADELRAAGFDVFGPSAAAAQLEGSKAFAKEVMAAAGVPTAGHWVATTPREVADILDRLPPPYVVKHDELAAGKGVIVTLDQAEAERHAVGHRVVIEEYLDGPEVSLFCLTDGETVVPLVPAQDFKRVGDDDAGPNTGGMGAYAPLPWATPDLVDQVVTHVVRPTIAELARRGAPFSGLLYVGLALTSSGVKVVEFNVRFGDPETQAVLALLETPLGGLLQATATGELDAQPRLTWRAGSAVTVVLASAGYPADPRTGDTITGLEAIEGASVLHAGTAYDGDRLVTSGGRVLSVTAVGESLAAARESAYAGVAKIRIDGAHYRTDIAATAAKDEAAAERPETS